MKVLAAIVFVLIVTPVAAQYDRWGRNPELERDELQQQQNELDQQMRNQRDEINELREQQEELRRYNRQLQVWREYCRRSSDPRCRH